MTNRILAGSILTPVVLALDACSDGGPQPSAIDDTGSGASPKVVLTVFSPGFKFDWKVH